MERVITAEGPRVKRKRSVVYPSVWVCTGVCRCVPVCSLRTSAAAAGSSERFCTWPSQQVLPTSSSTSFSDCFTTLGADSLLQLNILAFNCCCRPPPPACSSSSSSSSPHPPRSPDPPPAFSSFSSSSASLLLRLFVYSCYHFEPFLIENVSRFGWRKQRLSPHLHCRLKPKISAKFQSKINTCWPSYGINNSFVFLSRSIDDNCARIQVCAITRGINT